MKYELVEKSDDIVFCHRLFQEVFAYHHVVSRSLIRTLGPRGCVSLYDKNYFATKLL